MKSKKAVDFFGGRNGARRMNCAQAVAAAFEPERLFSKEEFQELAVCSYGRAPEGYCGGAYAAIKALEKIDTAAKAQFMDDFSEYAGSLSCKVIRSKKKVTCSQCVERSAGFIEKILIQNKKEIYE
jgi:hypothetical protein